MRRGSPCLTGTPPPDMTYRVPTIGGEERKGGRRGEGEEEKGGHTYPTSGL